MRVVNRKPFAESFRVRFHIYVYVYKYICRTVHKAVFVYPRFFCRSYWKVLPPQQVEKSHQYLFVFFHCAPKAYLPGTCTYIVYIYKYGIYVHDIYIYMYRFIDDRRTDDLTHACSCYWCLYFAASCICFATLAQGKREYTKTNI